ncbi:MAG: SusC/RagA family TonB-linked outer membrane protein [Dysgonomonas sp.]
MNKPIMRNTIRKLLFFVFLAIASVSVSTNKAFAAGNPIEGVVVDANNEFILGATVMEKNTSNGTVTDINGHFILNVASDETILVFSYIGYDTQERKVKPGQILRIVMTENVNSLNELVVVGYGTKRKGGVSAAVTTIGSQDIARSTSTTTAGALVGKMAGITSRQKSGTPGSASSLQIRNMGTPLYVIDGIMRDEDAFNNLNTNDIDNISVLKDGSAAIYGVKAANGVVLVTTKSGTLNQKTQVNINAYTGWQQWTKYPKLLNASQWVYANYMRDVNSGTYVDPTLAQQEMDKWNSGYYNAATGEDYRGYNWMDEMVSNAAPQNYINANVSGGSENTTYYLSISHVDQDAVFKDYNFNRTNLQANIEMQVSKNLKIGYQANGKIEENSNPGLPGSDDYTLIKTSLMGLQPIYRPYANDNPLYLNYIEANDARNMAAFTKANAGTYDKKWRTIQNNFTAEYKTPLKGLTAKGLFSYYYGNNTTNNRELGWKEYTYDKATDSYLQRYERTDTYLVRERQNVEEMTGQLLLGYDNMFGKDHHVTATGGFEFYKYDSNFLNNTQSPIDNPLLDQMVTSESNTLYESSNTHTTASFIFRAGYEYKSKYILDFAGRYDASWLYAKGDRWGFFPSVSGAWRVSEENFFKNWGVSSWMSNLKLRASYGEMGNENIGSLYQEFAYLPGYTYNNGATLLPTDLTSDNSKYVIGSAYRGEPITGISWIKTSILNLGIDLGFFNNRLNAEVDVFRRKLDGIPAYPDIILPLESGLTVMPQNLNSDENVGIDGFIKWTDNFSDVKYFVGANATLARQKNGKRYGEQFYNAWDKYMNSESNRWSNVSSGQVWMWETIGVFQTQEEIDNYAVNIDGQNNTTLVPGDLIFKDVNGDGVINDYDKRPLGYSAVDWPWDSSKGNKNPLLSCGFNFGFEWKGIDFAADFAGGFMNTFVPDWNMKWGVNRTYNGYVYNSLDVWHHADILDPTSAWVAGRFPALRASNPSTRGENTFYTKNVNYLRLRNLAIGYTLPKKWLPSIQKVRFYMEGTNLFCWDTLGDYGIDPETSTVNGTDYPQSRVYTIGVNVTF